MVFYGILFGGIYPNSGKKGRKKTRERERNPIPEVRMDVNHMSCTVMSTIAQECVPLKTDLTMTSRIHKPPLK